jgi:hypothetical protein
MKPCLKCKYWVQCKDSEKGTENYKCQKFAVINVTQESLGKRLPIFFEKDEYTVPVETDVPIESIYGDMDDLDVVSMIEGSYDEDTHSVRDLKIDDRDLPRAHNFFDYCFNHTDKDAKKPFARMMWSGIKLGAEYCPKCSNPKWLKAITNIPVDYPTKDIQEHIQLLKLGICPKCKGKRSEFIKSGQLNLYSEFDACLGQRGTKSAFTTMFASYYIHCYLKLPKLSQVCDGMDSTTPITATFVGLRFTDAFTLLWTPLMKIIEKSPWFVDYHKMLDYNGAKLGKQLYKKNNLFMRYEHKNMELYPSGPTHRGLRGRTRFFSATDELGWFPIHAKKDNAAGTPEEEADRERADGNEVHHSLDRSMLSVRAEVRRLIYEKGYNTFLTAMNVCTSSPSSQKDKIMRLVRENKNSAEAFTLHLPTWEVNPRYPRDCREIAEAYRVNAVKAERDYGANPPKTSSPFIANTDIKQCFTGINRVATKSIDRDFNGRIYRAAQLSKISQPNDLPPSIMALDAGYSNNSFAISIGSRDGLQVSVPVLAEIQPGNGAVLHYNALYKHIIVPLIEKFNVKFVFADRWQSIAHLHRIQEEYKIEAEMYSVKMVDFNLIRSKAENKELILPQVERDVADEETVVNYPNCFIGCPGAHLQLQMLTVKDSGRTVLKGDGYTDDLFRALTLMVSRLYDEKIWEKLKKMQPRRRSAFLVGIVRSKGDFTRLHQGHRLAQVSYGGRTLL